MREEIANCFLSLIDALRERAWKKGTEQNMQQSEIFLILELSDSLHLVFLNPNLDVKFLETLNL